MTNPSDWPLYFKDRLILGNPDSEVGVVCLWTPKEAMVGQFSPSDYCLLGQLYTKRGINYILRNILARPIIRQIIITGSDLSGSGEALLALAKNGVEEVNGRKQVKGVENAFIDSEISLEAIEDFRKNVDIIFPVGAIQESPQLRAHRDAPLQGANIYWREPEIFAESKIGQTEMFPSEQTVFTIRRGLIGEAWVEVLKHVLKFGQTEPTIYGGTKKELLNVTVVIDGEDPSDFKVPAYLNLSATDVKNYIDKVFAPERGEEPYTYGERLLAYDPADKLLRPQQFVRKDVDFPINQIDLMVKKLTRYPEDVGALAILWQPEIDNFPIRNPWRTPCLTLIQGVCHADMFYMTAYFRSNDMFGAWPLNCFALRHLQSELSGRINRKLGPLTTISSCAHIYDNALAEASRVVAENDKLACRTDPRGNFVIEVVDKDIVVKHLSPAGVVIAEYHQDGTVVNAAQKLANQLVQNLGLSDISHALDLGSQLARAEEAIRHHLKFTQDRPLS